MVTFYQIQIKYIQRIQRNLTRYALHYPTITYKERCEYLNIIVCPQGDDRHQTALEIIICIRFF